MVNDVYKRERPYLIEGLDYYDIIMSNIYTFLHSISCT
jgi:hypothetical protein